MGSVASISIHMNPTDKRSKGLFKKKVAFDARTFLDSAGVARKIRRFKKAEIIYSQGTRADCAMYIEEGGVKITVISAAGKEAIIATLGPGDFFGEGCLAGQKVRMGNARATTPSTVLVIEKNEMLRVLHEHRDLSDLFTHFVLARNNRIEEDLVDRLTPTAYNTDRRQQQQCQRTFCGQAQSHLPCFGLYIDPSQSSRNSAIT
jgi:CRP-like cAMP-binding protein